MHDSLPQRKRPAHVPPVESHNAPVILFVTICLRPRVPRLADAQFLDAFVLACRDADAWSVGRYMIMPDHVHLFCAPARYPRIGIGPWSTFFKRRVTEHYGVRDWAWQSNAWDTQLRNRAHYHDKWEYVRQNPVRKALVQRAEDWPWQGELNVLQW